MSAVEANHHGDSPDGGRQGGDYKRHFTRFLGPTGRQGRLHLAAHSHHPWPDVTFEAQQRAWLDAAALHDDKWNLLLGEVLPEAAAHVAGRLHLPDAATITFAPNTHEFVLRLLSCLPVPTRILTTDSEFHSFARQAARLEEAGLAIVERVAAEPFASCARRLRQAARRGGHDLVFVSQVQFNSGLAIRDSDLAEITAAVPSDATFVVIDGYHGFMALPTDLGPVAHRAFYLAGGYKYAMAGEGACFLHCPPGYGERPVNTGWFADMPHLTGDRQVRYAPGGARFAGATFDLTAVYRFNAVQRLLDGLGLSVAGIHAHVRGLQEHFLDRLAALAPPALDSSTLVPPRGVGERGHFLTFRLPDAAAVCQRLRHHDVITDYRADRLRVGFGIYHDDSDVEVLCDRLTASLGAGA